MDALGSLILFFKHIYTRLFLSKKYIHLSTGAQKGHLVIILDKLCVSNPNYIIIKRALFGVILRD